MQAQNPYGLARQLSANTRLHSMVGSLGLSSMPARPMLLKSSHFARERSTRAPGRAGQLWQNGIHLAESPGPSPLGLVGPQLQ